MEEPKVLLVLTESVPPRTADCVCVRILAGNLAMDVALRRRNVDSTGRRRRAATRTAADRRACLAIADATRTNVISTSCHYSGDSSKQRS